jgi:hypothetical protein
MLVGGNLDGAMAYRPDLIWYVLVDAFESFVHVLVTDREEEARY